MELNIAIMDDEQTFCDFLENKLKIWGKETSNIVNISCYNRSDTFIDIWETQKHFDAIFLDIRIKNCDLNGMDVAHKIREQNDDTAIVFTTSIADYLKEGYRVDAVRYLLKPIQDYDFQECMNRLSVKFQTKGNEIFLLKFKGRLIRIPYKDILYFSSLNNYTEIHTKTEPIKYLKKLKYIEDTLPPQFVRCHRSVIINIENISAIIGNTVVMSNDEQLPMSKQYCSEIQYKFIQYFG